jgi:hypothetical protein
MEPFRETAFCLTLWHAFLTVLVAVLVIALSGLDTPTALLAAANIALLFAFALMARAGRSTEANITRGQYWRTLPKQKRPAGEGGARLAHRALQETLLGFAKGAALIAVALAGLAYLSNSTSASGWAKAVRATASAEAAANNHWTGYRSARLLPTN